ncbi:MAG TPA: hypothetical protein VI358_18170 [Pseudolabrys sp.]
MSTFERTEQGFASALASAEWMASFHNRDYALLVHRTQPRSYVVSLPSLIDEGDVEPGTRANLIHPDGSQSLMF